jgi:hypothetical protein
MPGRLVFATTADGASSPTERMRISSTGLHTITASDNSTAVQIRDASNYAGQLITATDGTFEINARTTTRFTRTGSNTESMRLDSTGRLLVGTPNSEPVGFDHLLQLEHGSGNRGISLIQNSNDAFASHIDFAKSRSTGAGGNTIVQNGDGLGSIIWRGADGSDKASSAAYITCQVDGTPSGNDMPGRLIFATTESGASSSTERMRIAQDGIFNQFTDDSFSIRTVRTGTGAGILSMRNGATSITNGTQVFVVRADGDCENTNNSYGALSDIKLKENIIDASSQWDDLKAIQVRKYNFKEETKYGTHTQLGVVAQEVELVSPGLVSETPDIDDEGNDLGTTTKSVNYSVLYMKAVKALQEAMERIETLEAKVAALEAN